MAKHIRGCVYLFIRTMEFGYLLSHVRLQKSYIYRQIYFINHFKTWDNCVFTYVSKILIITLTHRYLLYLKNYWRTHTFIHAESFRVRKEIHTSTDDKKYSFVFFWQKYLDRTNVNWWTTEFFFCNLFINMFYADEIVCHPNRKKLRCQRFYSEKERFVGQQFYILQRPLISNQKGKIWWDVVCEMCECFATL